MRWRATTVTILVGAALVGTCVSISGAWLVSVIAGLAGGLAVWLALDRADALRRFQTRLGEARDMLGAGSGAALFTWSAAGDVWFADEWRENFRLPTGTHAHPAHWLERVHHEDLPALVHAIENGRVGRAPNLHETFRLRVRDDWRWCELVGRAHEGPEGVTLAGAVRDVTTVQAAHERLSHSAFHDPLTGLANRALFMDRLSHCAARARRNPRYRFALVYLDVDDFKLINDSLGHLVGDEVLKVVAARLVSAARPGDTVARIGGDEFTVLLEPLESERDAERVTTRIRQAVHGPVELHGHRTQLSTSAGIAFSSATFDPLEMLRDADTAMYQAKRAGPGRQQLFDQHMHDTAMRRLHVESELRRGLESGGLAVHYQPIVNLGTGGIEGFEGLARLFTTVGMMIGPAEFIPVAESQGLVDRVLDIVLADAAERLAAWSELDKSLYVSVNLSARSVHPGLAERLAKALDERGLEPHRLKLELTESVLASGSQQTSEVLGSLRAHGIGVYIDDFGTGYSSLSYLHQFPIDRIKLDRTFVMGLDGRKTPEIVQTIVALAHRIGAAVIAEGIETETQLEALRLMGCVSGQGYLFSPALPFETATKLVADRRVWPLGPSEPTRPNVG